MHLLVGIDTEGDNQWDAAARANQRFENLYALPVLHALFARHGVRPTYVITYPVARDPRSAAVLRELKARGDCEIGAHHHAWETPPCTDRRHPPARLRREPAAAAVRGAAGVADGRNRRSGRGTPGVVPIGPLRLFRGPRRRARDARLRSRVQRRAAVLRGAQAGARLRRGAAHAVLSRLRQRHPRGHQQPARSAGFGGAQPQGAEAAAVPLRARAEAVHHQARAAKARRGARALASPVGTRRSTT